MTQAVAEILQAVERLSSDERAELTNFQVENQDVEFSTERERQILAEVIRRAAEVDSGRVQTIPIEVVFAEIDELLNRPD